VGLLGELATALGLTVVIELATVALLGGRSVRELAAVALVNVVTNPPLVLSLLALNAVLVARLSADAAFAAYWGAVAIGEVIVVIVEWRLLAWALRADSRLWLARSIAMNAASFVLGSALMALLVH
jgi:hypothetical protein